MKLTNATFSHMLKHIRAIYGSNWRSDLENDGESRTYFFQNCQELIPEELAAQFIQVYCACRSRAPYSPYDILEVNIEKRLEDAKSSEFVIEKLITAIRDYEYSEEELPFDGRDEYLFTNVIPMLPCPSGVREFYVKNKKKLERLALRSPDEYEESKIYADLDKDYDKQLVIIERRSVFEMINHTALPNGNNSKRLEG